MGRGIRKRRSKPRRLTETLTTRRTQHQLEKERLSVAPVSLLLTCYAALGLAIRPLLL